MQITGESFILIERWSKRISVVFFWLLNSLDLLLLFSGRIPGVGFLLGAVLSVISYIVYLKYVRGKLEKSIERSQ